MSGVITPVHIIVEPFGTDAAALPPTDPGGVTLPIPVASQVGVLVGAASFADGFPAATMSDPETEGGVPPYGQDVTGILYMITAYIAMLQAGQRCTFNAVAATAFGGYAVGATVDSVTTPGLSYVNVLNANTNDPDTVITGWVPIRQTSTPTDRLAVAPAAGTTHNLAVGKNVGFLDVDTTAGNVTITGLTAGTDGQILVITCTGANLLTLAALTGSTAPNQFRLPTDLSFTLNDGMSVRYSATVGKWVRM